jgi:hypothetical protein
MHGVARALLSCAAAGLVFGVSACGSAPYASPSRPVARPHRLALLPEAGTALGLLASPRTIFLTTQGSGSSVELWLEAYTGRQWRSVLRYRVSAWTPTTGALLQLGSTPIAAATTSIYARQGADWAQEPVPPGSLGTAAGLAGTSSTWWDLAWGVGAAGNEMVTLWQSTTQGRRWQRVAVADPQELSGTGLPYFGDKNGIAVQGGSRLWLTGATMVLGHVWAYSSADAGRHWRSVSVPVSPAWSLNELTSYPPLFVQPGGWGYLPVRMVGRHVRLVLYRIHGQTSRLTLVAVGPILARGLPWTVTVGEGGQLWVGTGQDLWTSDDQGRQWTLAATVPTGWVIHTVSLARNGRGVLLAVRTATPDGVSDYALWRTTDGGSTWAPLKGPG